MAKLDIFGDVIEEQEVTEDEKEVKVSIFDIFNDIGFDKKYIYDESVFNIFLAMRAFSQHPDTILYANEINKNSFKSKLFAHDFLFYSIRKKKRYGKWAKAQDDEKIIELIKKKYVLNNDVARQYFEMMTEEQRKQLENEFVIGGCK